MKSRICLVVVLMAATFGFPTTCPGAPVTGPERATKVVLVEVSGAYRPVVGAARTYPVLIMEDGSTETVWRSRFYYVVTTRFLQERGQVTIFNNEPFRGNPRAGFSGGRRIKFSTKHDCDDLYVIFYRVQKDTGRVVNVWFHQIGPTKAGEKYNNSFELAVTAGWNFRDGRYHRTEFEFYEGGYPLARRHPSE